MYGRDIAREISTMTDGKKAYDFDAQLDNVMARRDHLARAQKDFPAMRAAAGQSLDTGRSLHDPDRPQPMARSQMQIADHTHHNLFHSGLAERG